MAIKIQVKGDKKFEDTFATTECCNGTYVNDAFGQFGQTWATPVDAINLNPAYTTTMLDGLYAQTPASLVSLFNANAALPCGHQGFTSFAPAYGNPVAYANTSTAPFASSLPFASSMNTASQAAPFAATNFYGAAPASFTGSTSSFGAPVPAATDVFGMAPWSKTPATQNAKTPIMASQIASELTAYGICPFIASQIASTAIASPVQATTLASQYGVNPALVSQLIAKSSIAWSNAAATPFTSAANTMNASDMSSQMNTAAPTTSPWVAARNAFGAIAQQSQLNASMMPVDIYETEDEYILLSDMPGASIEDIEIVLEGKMLVIKGLIKPASWNKLGLSSNAVAVLQEKPAVKNIQRVFPITNDVLVDKLTAKLTEGILTVKLPKVKVGFGSTRRVAVATI
jgi:HSP20 family molecular chaperone IbpA